MIGRCSPRKLPHNTATKMQAPLFSVGKNAGSTNPFDKPPYHSTIITTHHRTLSTMNTSPTEYGGPSPSGDPGPYGISHARADNSTTNNVHGNSNTNVGNVLNSYNNSNIINVGVSEESLRIQVWLSPLEPHRRHQDVRNRRLDDVGEWVLRRTEFESWCESQEGSVNPTLLCYGGQGVGKTYIRQGVFSGSDGRC